MSTKPTSSTSSSSSTSSTQIGNQQSQNPSVDPAIENINSVATSAFRRVSSSRQQLQMPSVQLLTFPAVDTQQPMPQQQPIPQQDPMLQQQQMLQQQAVPQQQPMIQQCFWSNPLPLFSIPFSMNMTSQPISEPQPSFSSQVHPITAWVISNHDTQRNLSQFVSHQQDLPQRALNIVRGSPSEHKTPLETSRLVRALSGNQIHSNNSGHVNSQRPSQQFVRSNSAPKVDEVVSSSASSSHTQSQVVAQNPSPVFQVEDFTFNEARPLINCLEHKSGENRLIAAFLFYFSWNQQIDHLLGRVPDKDIKEKFGNAFFESYGRDSGKAIYANFFNGFIRESGLLKTFNTLIDEITKRLEKGDLFGANLNKLELALHRIKIAKEKFEKTMTGLSLSK